ncbi:hypothetical protein Agau_C201659 [Agrobacterium tumefaciens F2]|nr:hypothetical protein Agau_C201659 [Agrobacterium tumefaciens F2]
MTIGCDFASGADFAVAVLVFLNDDGEIHMDALDENDLARVTVEGIVPHAPIRPFEPNRFSKSRGRI